MAGRWQQRGPPRALGRRPGQRALRGGASASLAPPHGGFAQATVWPATCRFWPLTLCRQRRPRTGAREPALRPLGWDLRGRPAALGPATPEPRP